MLRQILSRTPNFAAPGYTPPHVPPIQHRFANGRPCRNFGSTATWLGGNFHIR